MSSSPSLRTVLQGEPESEGNLENEVAWNWSELARHHEVTLSDVEVSDGESDSDSEWTPDSEEELDAGSVSTDEGESDSESEWDEE